jgi:thiamine kinase-like enzyme
MNIVKYMLYNILTKNSGLKFYTFSNADGKAWLMPAKNIRTAMNLYQPGGINGKLLKMFSPYVHYVASVRKILNIRENSYALQEELHRLLCDIFHSTEIEFSIFCGTPSKHQKITMQISCGNRILGYCKFSDNEEVKALFSHEQIIFNTLKEKGIKQIPECLFCGIWKENITVFVQSTIKTNHSKVLHSWTVLHDSFLKELHKKTVQKLPFHATDFYNSIQLLRQNIYCISESERDVVCQAIDIVLDFYKNRIVTFSVYHGDFTPWNMFVEKKQLYVFDWEYGGLTYPPYLDWFHFFTQCCIFEKHLTSKNTHQLYVQRKCELDNWFENSDFYYICYLLDIVSRYANRDKGVFNAEMSHSISVWINLIKIIICEHC